MLTHTLTAFHRSVPFKSTHTSRVVELAISLPFQLSKPLLSNIVQQSLTALQSSFSRQQTEQTKKAASTSLMNLVSLITELLSRLPEESEASLLSLNLCEALCPTLSTSPKCQALLAKYISMRGFAAAKPMYVLMHSNWPVY